MKTLVDNRIKVGGGKQKVFHINMPKLCHERVDNDQDSYVKTDIATCLNVISGLNTEEGVHDDEVNPTIAPPLERKETIDDVHISHDLSEEEKKQLKDLLREYQDIFSDLPQVTNIIDYPAISTFAVQICYTNKFLLYSYQTNKLFSLRINFPGTL